MGVLKQRRRIRDVEPRDPQHRSAQRVEAPLLHPRRDLGAHPGEALRLVHHQAPAGPPHRRLQRTVVERDEGAQVQHLDVQAFRGGQLSGFERYGDRGAVRHERGVTSGAAHPAVPNGSVRSGSSSGSLVQ